MTVNQRAGRHVSEGRSSGVLQGPWHTPWVWINVGVIVSAGGPLLRVPENGEPIWENDPQVVFSSAKTSPYAG